MRVNFILSKIVRRTYYLCGEVALYINIREGNKVSDMKDKGKTNEGEIPYLVSGPREDMSEG